MQTGGYAGRVGSLTVALGIGSAVAMGMGCGVAAADPTHSSTSSGSSGASEPSAKTPDRTKRKRQRTTKTRKPVVDAKAGETGAEAAEDIPKTPRTAIDKVGATVRTAVRDALDSLDFHRPGSDDKGDQTAVKVFTTTKTPTKRRARAIEHPEADAVIAPDIEPRVAPDAAPRVVDVAPVKTELEAPVAVAVESIVQIPKSALTRDPAPHVPPPPQIDKAGTVVTEAVATVINTVLNPFSVNSTPDSPAEPPAAWAMLAFARREFEHAFRQPQDLLTQASTLTSTVVAEGPVALAPGIVVPGSLIDNVDVTDGASLFDQLTVSALSAFRQVAETIGIDITTSLGGGIVVPDPPRILTLGLDVRATEFTAEDADGVEQTWQVWEISNPRSDSDEHVIAFHGGGLTAAPTIFHWLDYAQMSRQTGATVIVPRYPLIPDGGTADNTIPPAADLIAAYVTEHGAENVNVYGESSGGMIAMLAVQKIARDCAGDTQCLSSRMPSRMVLSSPAVADPDFATDPNVVLVNDPLFGVPTSDNGFAQWQSQQHPELSDTFRGPVEGLPQTTIYIGTREVIAPGTLKFAKLMDDAGSDVSVVIGMGQMHGWATIPINSQYANYRDDIYRQLGIVGDDDAESTVEL